GRAVTSPPVGGRPASRRPHVGRGCGPPPTPPAARRVTGGAARPPPRRGCGRRRAERAGVRPPSGPAGDPVEPSPTHQPEQRRAMKGTHPWMLTTAECAATDTARKIVSAVVAPMPTRNPARHDRQILYRPAGSCGRAYRRIDVQPRAIPETGRRAARIRLRLRGARSDVAHVGADEVGGGSGGPREAPPPVHRPSTDVALPPGRPRPVRRLHRR